MAARLDIAIDVAHAITYLHMYTGMSAYHGFKLSGQNLGCPRYSMHRPVLGAEFCRTAAHASRTWHKHQTRFYVGSWGLPFLDKFPFLFVKIFNALVLEHQVFKCLIQILDEIKSSNDMYALNIIEYEFVKTLKLGCR